MPTDTASPTRAVATPARGAAQPGKNRGKSGTGGDATEKKSPKRKKLIIAILAAVVLAAGLGYYTFGMSSAPKPVVPGAVVKMDDMTLNLADSHFLRLKISLQTVEGTDEAMDTSKAAQLVISQFSNRPMAELGSDAARTAAKTALLTKVQEAYPDKIIDLYYTEFVMQ